MAKPSPLDTPAVALLALSATLAAWALRTWGAYPLNPSDERNWIAIAAEVANGVDWPISGPLHFAATQALASWVGVSHADALAILGVTAVPFVLITYVLSYRLLGVSNLWQALLLLSASTYFWAPLLESRPQQWGQALVLLNASIAWRLFSHGSIANGIQLLLAWAGWGALFLLTCWAHLLSGPIAFGLCGLVAAGCLALQPKRYLGVALWVLASAPGLFILVWPSGPYRAMLNGTGLSEQVLSVAVWWPAVLMGLCLLLAGIRILGPRLVNTCLCSLEMHPKAWMATLSIGVVTLLALQALMLPAMAWASYQGSLLLFVSRQVGNLFFFCMLLMGLLHVATDSKLRTAAPWPGLFALLAAMAVLAGLSLALSVVTRDTNWMLRIINYALPIGAPFAGMGWVRWRLAITSKIMVSAALTALSLCAAGGVDLRPQQLLGTSSLLGQFQT